VRERDENATAQRAVAGGVVGLHHRLVSVVAAIGVLTTIARVIVGDANTFVQTRQNTTAESSHDPDIARG
jgi:hypothetical protein